MAAACAASAAPPPQGGDKRPRHRRVFKLACVRPDTPLTVALGLLLEAGVSCLPVVDPSGVLLDLYARADICMLAKVGRWGALVHAWLWGEALNICMHAGKGDAMACLPLVALPLLRAQEHGCECMHLCMHSQMHTQICECICV
jgi:hypothetical protein